MDYFQIKVTTFCLPVNFNSKMEREFLTFHSDIYNSDIPKEEKNSDF